MSDINQEHYRKLAEWAESDDREIHPDRALHGRPAAEASRELLRQAGGRPSIDPDPDASGAAPRRQVRLPRTLNTQLDNLAAERGRSASDLMRDAITAYARGSVSGVEPVGGEFWTLENPGLRVPGAFTAEVGKRPEARLVAGLVADPRVHAFDTPAGGKGVAFSAVPAKSVQAFQPITLQGQLDNGESVTLLNAQNYGGDGQFNSPPRYVAHVAVLGAHVAGTDQLYSAVRFRIDDPYWLAHLPGGESSVVADDGSTLSVEASEEGNWLVYVSSVPATLRQLEIRVVSGSLVLVQLATDQNLVIRETQVRVDADGPWLTVYGPAFRESANGVDPETLLARKELTVARFAKWIALNDTLDGLAWAVAKPVEGVLQVQAQVLTSLVEGLHRRLPYEQSRFPDVTRSALRQILEAARDAADVQAGAEGLDRKQVTQAVILLGEVSFRDRAEVVVAKVRGAVPEIVESVADLPARLTKVRNDFAHQLLQDETKEPLELRYRRWLVVTRITPWLLRGLLLLHAGVEPSALRDGYLKHQRFGFTRANVAQLVKELGQTQKQTPDQKSVTARPRRGNETGLSAGTRRIVKKSGRSNSVGRRGEMATSKKDASLAGKQLASKSTTKAQKSVAASDLAQTKSTGKGKGKK